MNQVAHAEPADSAYLGLYRLGCAAAWIAAILIWGEVIAFAFYPLPSMVSG